MSLVFTRSRPGTYVEATDSWTDPTTTTIEGNAIQKRGDPQKLMALELTLSTTVTFFFTPTLYNLRAYTPEFVLPGDSVVHNGVTFTVREVDPNPAPDGYVIGATIIASA